MQEEIENKTIALSIKATKLTAKILAKACAAGLRQIQKNIEKGRTPQGKQSVEKLMNHRVATKAMPLDEETRLFDKVAREHNVDYAFHKTGPNKHLLFFKAEQADAIQHCFAEYTELYMKRAKEKRPSIKKDLEKHGKRIRTRTKPPLERVKEAVRVDR